MNTFSIKEAVMFGWETFKKDPAFYAGVTFVLSAASFVINLIIGDGYGLMALVWFVVSFAVSTFVTIAYSRVALSAQTGQRIAWEGLWAPEHFLRMLGTTILQGIIVVVGLVLLIIPGIVAALMLSMSQLLVVDKKLMPIEALKESYRLTKGHLLQLFLFALTIAAINIVGAILLLVGLLVSIPVSLVAAAYVYKKLSSLEVPAVIVAESN